MLEITTRDLTQDYFSLFNLEAEFEIDSELLTQRYRAIQNQVHPDRFAGNSEQEQRFAVQYTSFVNQAYQCLKQPLERAKYLLKLRGAEVNLDTQKQLDPVFLMEQIELREKLEAVTAAKNPQAAFLDFFKLLESKTKELQQAFLRQLKATQYEAAKNTVAKWQFLVKLQQEARRLEDAFED